MTDTLNTYISPDDSSITKDKQAQVNNKTWKNTVLQNVYDKPNGLIIATIKAGPVVVLEDGVDWVKIQEGWIQKLYLIE